MNSENGKSADGGSSSQKAVDLFERTAKAIALASGLALALSVAYDWAYLLALGLSLNEVQTSIQDHIRTVVIWAPLLGVAALLFQPFLPLLTSKKAAEIGSMKKLIEDIPPSNMAGKEMMMNILDEREKESKDAYKKRRRMFFAIILAIAALLALCSYLFISRQWQLLWPIIPVAFFAISLFIIGKRAVYEELYALGASASVILIIIIELGFAQGLALADGEKSKWDCVLKTPDGSTKTASLTGVRKFGETAILVDDAKGIAIVPSSSILELRKNSQAAKAPAAPDKTPSKNAP